ncbi:hypothetical protein HMPREF1419_00728 [Helicobacter pylori GAM263BFi]|nr:hypothetical protein HMPREF1419_00728 [Helicobacter pylori GAM263BFi]
MIHPFKSGLVKTLKNFNFAQKRRYLQKKGEKIIASFGYFVKHCPTLITRLQQMGCKRA